MRQTQAVLLAVTLLIARPVSAWESDLHYGLTKWLAMQAGLEEEDAQVIAEGTLNLDHGIFDARYLVFFYACIGRDVQASQLVQDAHFPSSHPPPGKPEARQVVAGSEDASVRARQEVEVSRPTRRGSLVKFGEALHPLQDSWSHQGVPGIPQVAFVSCSEELSWGHPDSRYGWSSHNADLTHLYPDDTLLVAKATYELLNAYLEKRKWPRSGTLWTRLEGEVKEFAGLDSKAKKKSWFAKRGFKDFDFLTETTLEDGGEVYEYSARLTRMPPRGLPATLKELGAIEVPEEVKVFFRDFITRWITEPDFEPVITRFVDREAVMKHMAVELRAKKKMTPDMATAMFWSWRLRDHGLANRLVHGLDLPEGAKARAVFKDAAKRSKGLTDFKSVEEALVPLGEGAPPYLVVALQNRRSGGIPQKQEEPPYAALLRFKNAPHDVVLVTAAKLGKDWRIVSLTWSLDH